MGKFIGKLLYFLFTIFIILIFFITTYFCLEVFGIIIVPKEYSLLELLNSNTEVIGSALDYIQISIDETEFEDKLQNTNSIVVELEGNNVTTIRLENGNEKQVLASNKNYFKYYDQLNETAKKMYDAIENNKDKLKTGLYTFDFGTEFNDLLHQEYGDELLNNCFQLAVNAFALDHPEIFYIDITQMYLLTEITKRPFSKTYRVSIGPNENNYLYDEYEGEINVDLAIKEIEEIKENIKQNAIGNDYDKIKYVHDYLVGTINYEKDIETHNNYNIYGALSVKKVVCEGYAKAFKYILDDLQIPCILVFGIAENSAGEIESHAWNYVWIDNKWYAVDVTWDDPVIIGIGYLPKKTKYKYFLKGSNNFFEDHTEDGTIVDAGTFIYPALSEADY